MPIKLTSKSLKKKTLLILMKYINIYLLPEKNTRPVYGMSCISSVPSSRRCDVGNKTVTLS